MKTLKFGGTSLKNAKKFLIVSKIIIENFKKEQVSVVLSAPDQITDQLVLTVKNSIHGSNRYLDNMKNIKSIFNIITKNIENKLPNFLSKKLNDHINLELNNLTNILTGISLLKYCPKNIYALIISRGEILSIAIMNSILQYEKLNTFIIDPVKNLFATENYLNANVNIQESKKKLQKIDIHSNNIILMPGFIAGNKNQELVSLGRNGSDYSAAILSVCLESNALEIWTDVDGMYTSDPREVSDAQLISKISYQEALELSYYGSKILHPKTLLPIIKSKIPCLIKNTLNPNLISGTQITSLKESEKLKKQNTITGITHSDNIVMISVTCLTTKFIFKIKQKIYSFFYNSKIWIPIITQSSCNNIINFYISEEELPNIQYLFKEEFKIELKNKLLLPIKIITKLSIITIVGYLIKSKKNFFGKIFSTLSKKNIHIHDISYGSSQYSISIIVNSENTIRIINSIHQKIFTQQNIIEIFLIGIGGVGETLLKQIEKQQKKLKEKNIHIKIHGIANSKKFLYKKNGIDLKQWKYLFKKSNQKFDFDHLKKLIKNQFLDNPTIIDCTASQSIANQYENFLSNGFHIVTSNKKSNTNDYHSYQQIRNSAILNKRKFLYETNVGASLPIIENLKNLLKSGDKLIQFRGILSGSLSFIFSQLDDGIITFSEATKKARKLGFTEPNPKDDLSGLDVARKLLILARECGYSINLQDIEIDPIIPKKMQNIFDLDEFMKELKNLDNDFLIKTKKLKKNKKVIRIIGSINNQGQCKVQMLEVDHTDPLYNIKNGENVFIFHTKYYTPMPLIIRGYGAGNNITAAGVFSDIIQIIS